MGLRVEQGGVAISCVPILLAVGATYLSAGSGRDSCGSPWKQSLPLEGVSTRISVLVVEIYLGRHSISTNSRRHGP